MITLGLIAISIIQRKLAEEEAKQNKIFIDRKYKLGAVALIFPILYAVIDALGTFLDDVYLSNLMSPEEALISYELTFLICGILALIYIVAIKKQKFEIFKERIRHWLQYFKQPVVFLCLCTRYKLSCGSTNGASYSIVSVILGRIFLKEKLTFKQYAVIAVVMIGIFILGMFE